MAKKITKPKFSQAEKDQLKILKQKGIYTPKNPRSAPTRYAKSLLKQYSDVIKGSSKAVKTDYKTARELKREKSKPGNVRVHGNRVIVPVLPGEKARFNRKTKEIEVSRTLETGQKYVRSPFKKQPKSIAGLQSQLKPNDRIAVPYYRGVGKPVDWTYFDLTEFERTFEQGYGERNDQQTKALKWALANAQISRYVDAKQKRIINV